MIKLNLMIVVKRILSNWLKSKLKRKAAKVSLSSFSLYYKKSKSQKGDDLAKRATFYLNSPVKKIPVDSKMELFLIFFFDNNTKLIGDVNLLPNIYIPFFYNVDYETNPHDGWVWHDILGKKIPANRESSILEEAEAKFFSVWSKEATFDKCYILGTGPSLVHLENIDLNDGFRIVCNTIVKDKELWLKINPHLIVAGDAIYHFGHNDFAKAFRNDLKERLTDSPQTLFVYPYMFHPFLALDFEGFENQLIPIQIGKRNIIYSLKEEFKLPSLGNVLNLLLLPLGVTFSKNIYLLGFDGRAPSDKLFWSNSDKHFYSEHFDTIIKSHPKFFEHYFSKDNPTQYVKDVHGDVLHENLSRLECKGYNFEVMYPSWTPALNKRHKNIPNA